MHLDKAGNYNSLSEAIVGFSQYVRLEGLNVGIKECQEALLAAQIGTIDDPNIFGYALKSIFCSSQEEGELFDLLFRRFWLKEAMIAGKTTYKNQTNIQKQSPASLVWMVEKHGMAEQMGFVKNRNTTDAVLSLKILFITKSPKTGRRIICSIRRSI